MEKSYNGGMSLMITGLDGLRAVSHRRDHELESSISLNVHMLGFYCNLQNVFC